MRCVDTFIMSAQSMSRWIPVTLCVALVGCGGSGLTTGNLSVDCALSDTCVDIGDEDAEGADVGGEDVVLDVMSPEVDGAAPDVEADASLDVSLDVSLDAVDDVTPLDVADVSDLGEVPDTIDDDAVGPADPDSDDGGDVSDTVSAPECLSDNDCPPIDTCHQGVCDLGTFTCVAIAIPDGTDCDDGTACSLNDTCLGGVCVGGVAVSCDDDNVCTDDLCDPATGCVYSFNFGACDDGNGCTTNDMCSAGVCDGTTPACDDGNPCTLDQCVPGTAACVNTPDNLLPCSDGNACTGGDHCASGACVPGPDDGCDDGNDCTVDLCKAGVCKVLPLEDHPCEDGEICTVNDTCQLAVCLPGQLDPCDDDNPCTQDSCQMGQGCVHELLVDEPCDDGDVCTQGEVCDASSACVPLTTTDCDDDNPCTVDNCHPENACVYAIKGGACDDGNPCTAGDFCQVGECKGQPATCNDNDACTHDSCDEVLGCQFVSIAESCVDDELCTDDSCEPASGCVFTHNTLECDDGLLCTDSDVCTDGVCVGTDVVCEDAGACTQSSCDAEEGCVSVVVADSPCDDGDPCTGVGACDDEGACQQGEVLSVDDGVDCTLDACTLEGGLTHTPDDDACDIGRVCDPASGCVLADGTLLLLTKIAWSEGVGITWVAIHNAGDLPVDLRGLSIQGGATVAPLLAASGEPDASVIIAPATTVAAMAAPASLPDASTAGFTMVFGAPGSAPVLLPEGGELSLVTEIGEIVDMVGFVSLVTEGDVGPSDFPVVGGFATELGANSAAVSTSVTANDPAGLWCTWPDGAQAPEGPQLPCARSRLNELSLAGADGERWVEVHMPAGGLLEGLSLRFIDGDGVEVGVVGPLSGRTPMSSLVLVQDAVDDVAVPPLIDGAVQLVRLGELQDVYGFGAQTTAVDGALGLAMVEGSPGPAQGAGDAAGRVSDGVDTDDNASDWSVTAGGTPGGSNGSP